MNTFVGVIGALLFCFYSIKAQTDPEAGLVKIGQPWNYNISVPTIENCKDKNKCGIDLCGVQANIKVKWKKAPQSNGESKIKLTAEHPNFRENKTWTITIPNNETKILNEAMDICFSKCPTYWNELDTRPFIFNAAPEDMEVDSIIDVEINTEKSVSSECETKPKEETTMREETTPLDDEKIMSVGEEDLLDDETDHFKNFLIVCFAGFCGFLLYSFYRLVGFLREKFKTKSGVLPGPGPAVPAGDEHELAEKAPSGGSAGAGPSNDTSRGPLLPRSGNIRTKKGNKEE